MDRLEKSRSTRALKRSSFSWNLFRCIIVKVSLDLSLVRADAIGLKPVSKENVTLALTIQKFNESLSFTDEEAPSILSLTCFSILAEKDKCCKLMFTSGFPISYEECIGNISKVPNTKNEKGFKEEFVSDEILPFYYMSINEHQIQTFCVKTKDVAPCQAYEQHNGYHQYIYDESEREWSQYRHVLSPLHLPSETSKHGRILQTSISSNLSPDGGMHRPYHHSISITLPSESQPQTIEGEIIVLLPIPKDLFLDVDDPFTNGENCHLFFGGRHDLIKKESKCLLDVTLANEPGVIDIEQPSFVSPSHLISLKIRLDLELKWDRHVISDSQRELTVDFETMLHVRYPAPITKGDKGKRSVLVQVPLAFVYQGWVRLSSNEGMLKFDLHPKTKLYDDFILPLLDAKAGFDEHHDIVMVTTLLIAILGAWFMMIDLSKVALWR